MTNSPLITIDQNFDDSSLTRAEAVALLRTIVGRPWVHQGRDPFVSGVDCLGLLVWLARRMGYKVLRDRTDYPLDCPGVELREGLEANLVEIPLSERQEADVCLIKFPQDEVARHLGVAACGRYEEMIIHAFNNRRSIKRVVDEPIARWIPHIKACYRFPHFAL
jgi:hypothetical protein